MYQLIIILGVLALSTTSYAADNTLTITSSAAAAQAANQVKWNYYSNDMFAKAKNENKTVLLFVMSDTCPFCQQMKNDTLANSVIIDQISSRFYPVILDVATERKAAKKLGITTDPDIMYFDASGKLVKTNKGLIDAGSMLSEMAVASLLLNQTR